MSSSIPTSPKPSPGTEDLSGSPSVSDGMLASEPSSELSEVSSGMSSAQTQEAGKGDYLHSPVKKESPLIWVTSTPADPEENETKEEKNRHHEDCAQPGLVNDTETLPSFPSSETESSDQSGRTADAVKTVQPETNAGPQPSPSSPSNTPAENGQPLFPVTSAPEQEVSLKDGTAPPPASETSAEGMPPAPTAVVKAGGAALSVPGQTAHNAPDTTPAQLSDGDNGADDAAKVSSDNPDKKSSETSDTPATHSGGGDSGNGGGGGTDNVDTAEENDDAEEYEDEEDESEEEDGPTTLREHLLELRKRVFNMFLWVVIGFAICYPFATQIFEYLMTPMMGAMQEAMAKVKPAQTAEMANAFMLPLLDAMTSAMQSSTSAEMADNYKFLIQPMLETLLNMPQATPAATPTLIFTVPSEAFFTEMKVAFVAGLFLMSPMIFYQIWRFIAPGLYDEEKIFLLPLAFFSGLFFVSGAAFCYYVAFPVMFEFFMSYNSASITAMPSLRESLSFVMQILIAFGVVFELPLFTFFLARLGLVTGKMMRSFWRYAIIIILIVAAILTPPDIFSQTLMAGPMLALYGLSIIIAEIFGKKTPSESADEDSEQDGDEADLDGQTPETISTTKK